METVATPIPVVPLMAITDLAGDVVEIRRQIELRDDFIEPRLRRTPDYKPNVPEEAYHTAILEATLDEFEYVCEALAEVTGAAERSVVQLPAGPYVIWVLPAGREGKLANAELA